jgi:hypothetical protein
MSVDAFVQAGLVVGDQVLRMARSGGRTGVRETHVVPGALEANNKYRSLGSVA